MGDDNTRLELRKSCLLESHIEEKVSGEVGRLTDIFDRAHMIICCLNEVWGDVCKNNA